MHEGSPLNEVAQRLSDIKEYSTDLLVKEHVLNAELGDNDTIGLQLPPTKEIIVPELIVPNDLAHRQIATHLDIPQKYYDRCREEAPDLLTRNMNHWFAEKDQTRLLRLHRSYCRAFLSDRYRPLDNFDLAEAVLPQLQDGWEIQSCELTETHFYVKAIALDVPPKEVKVGDAIRIGVDIRNSDVGCSALAIAPRIERLICKNGMTVNDMASRKRHVGKRNNGFDETELVTQFLTDEAKQADDKAFWLKVRDTVAACAKEATLDLVVDQMQGASGIRMQGSPVQIVKNVCRTVGISEGEEVGVLEHLVRGGELSAYGMANAVTRQAEDVADYDRASELEQIGWQVLRLPVQSFALN